MAERASVLAKAKPLFTQGMGSVLGSCCLEEQERRTNEDVTENLKKEEDRAIADKSRKRRWTRWTSRWYVGREAEVNKRGSIVV